MRALFLSVVCVLSVCCPLAQAAINLSSGIYHQNFDGTLEADWVLSNVAALNLPTAGRTSIANVANGSTNFQGTVIQNSGGGFGTVGQMFAPIKPSDSYANHGFGGKWLTNSGGMTVPAVQTDLIRTATVTFDNLASHGAIGLQFLLGAGDTFDGPNEGILEIWVDGNKQWSQQFASGGNRATGSGNNSSYLNLGAAPTALVTNGNLIGTGFYSEAWSASATNDTQRTAHGWTTESAYRVQIDGIAHTTDTMTLQFVWRGINSDWTDEFLSIDNLVVMAPEPGVAGLLMLGVVGCVGRRRRRV